MLLRNRPNSFQFNHELIFHEKVGGKIAEHGTIFICNAQWVLLINFDP